MSLAEIEELTSCILDFQSNIVNVTIKKKDTPVDPEADANHALALNAIWEASRLEQEYEENGRHLKWRKLGFETEDVQYEFRDVGLLGLECLVSRCTGSVLYFCGVDRPTRRTMGSLPSFTL